MHGVHILSPLPFALVLLSIEWARCLGEMIMVRMNSSSPLCPMADARRKN